MFKNRQQKVLITLCCLFCFVSLKSQNLVPNSGAENYSTCPSGPNCLLYATPWNSYNSCDFFHYCSVTFTPTSNVLGSQLTKSGNGFYGGYSYYESISDDREFQYCSLLSLLQSGKSYCVKFYISLADSVTRAIDSYGMLISDSLLTQFPLQVYTPQIKNPTGNIMSDRTIWHEISGVYIAQGGEQYIHLGNFNNDANTNVVSLSGGGVIPNPAAWTNAYYYLDDISVEEIKPADAGPDVYVEYGSYAQIGNNPTEVAQYAWTPSSTVLDSTVANPYVNPPTTTTYTLTKNQCGVITTDDVTVKVNALIDVPTLLGENELWIIGRLQPNTKVRLYDMSGRLVYNKNNYQNELQSNTLSVGMYYYVFTPELGEAQQGKVMIAR